MTARSPASGFRSRLVVRKENLPPLSDVAVLYKRVQTTRYGFPSVSLSLETVTCDFVDRSKKIIIRYVEFNVLHGTSDRTKTENSFCNLNTLKLGISLFLKSKEKNFAKKELRHISN